MNKMFLDLNELEDMIKGNKDLKPIEEMMDVTGDTIDVHKKAFDSLKDSILSINKQAEAAMDSLNFYG